MSVGQRIVRSRLRVSSPWARVLIVVACLLLIAMSVYVAADSHHSRSQRNFTTITSDNAGALASRFREIERTLDGVAGFVRSRPDLTAEAWRSYVEALDLPGKMTMIAGIGFVVPVDGDALSGISARLAARGHAIHPPGTRDDRYIVEFIEPYRGNQDVVGLDLSFRPDRVEALLTARETRRTTLTSQLDLIQKREEQSGFLIFRPVHQVRPSANGPAGEEEVFLGWIDAVMTTGQLLSGMTAAQGADFVLSVVDVTDPESPRLVYQPDTPRADASYRRTHLIEVFGRTWQLEWRSTRQFEIGQQSFFPAYIALTGLVLMLLVIGMIGLLARKTAAIAQEVEERTRELAISVEQNQSIIHNAMVPIAVINAGGHITLVNPAFLELFNVGRQDVVHRSLSEFLPEIRTEPNLHRQVIKTTTTTGADLILKVQTSGWFSVAGRRRYLLLIEDITREHLMTAQLGDAERRWNLALSAAEIGVFDIDLTTGISVVSPSWLKLMNMTTAEAGENPHVEFKNRVHPDDIMKLQSENRDCIEGRSSQAIAEYRVQTSPGEWRWMRSNATVTAHDLDGKAVRLIGVQTDVTDLRNAQESLRESRKQFRRIVESAPVPMALLNRGGYFTRVNQALAELSGYEPSELVGLDFRALMAPDDLPEILEAAQKQIDEDGLVYRNERRFIRKDGTLNWILLTVSLARDSESGRDFFIAQFVDITPQKEAERSKREFFANMSHELRTPLTSVKGSIDLVLGSMRDDLPAGALKLLEIAKGNSTRLVTLINDFLDFEKITTNNMKFEFAAVNLCDMIHGAIERIQPMARTNDVEIETVIAPCRAQAWIDAGRFEQAITNLLSNAIKFSDAGDVVTVTLDETDEGFRITVSDTGVGIPESHRDLIFQPYSQVDGSATRKKGGTGLGLSIAKSMIEMMGGSISFTSAVDQGTTFTISLPNEPVPAE